MLAERYLKETREYIAKGDAIQASEKMYRVVERTQNPGGKEKREVVHVVAR